MNQLPEAARDAVRRAADATKEVANKANLIAKDVIDEIEDVAVATNDATKYAAAKTKEIYHSVVHKTGETLTTSKDYVRRHPVPVVIGAIAFGAALGCLLLMSRRKHMFGERYTDEPLLAVREAVLGALSPVTQRVHKGYDSARDGAERVMGRVQHFGTGRNNNSFSDQIGRIGSNLKFW